MATPVCAKSNPGHFADGNREEQKATAAFCSGMFPMFVVDFDIPDIVLEDTRF